MAGILDIPDITLLSINDININSLVTEFRKRLGVDPDAIALPVTSAQGLSFESSLGPMNLSFEAPPEKEEPADLQQAAKDAARAGLPVFLMMNPSLPFLTQNRSYSIVDQYGDESERCCVINEFTQEVCRTIIQEAIELVQGEDARVQGVVFVVQDLWPMGADGLNLPITCFCRYCLEGMNNAAADLDLELFRRSPGPLNLVLRDTGTGITSLSTLRPNDDPQSLLEGSKKRGFFKVLEDRGVAPGETQATHWATQLLTYIRARDQLVVTALNTILSCVPEGVARGVVVERDSWDWTVGLFRSSLGRLSVNEIWTIASSTGDQDFPEELTVRTYLATRARYQIDALFEIIRQVDRRAALDPAGLRLSAGPDLTFEFARRANLLLPGLNLSKMDTLPITRTGGSFVAPLLTADHIRRLMASRGMRAARAASAMTQLADYIKQAEFLERVETEP